MALVLDGNGTMTVGNGDITGLATGALPSNVIGAGAVLQVVHSDAVDQDYNGSMVLGSIIHTGASITPISATSKILAIASWKGEKVLGTGGSVSSTGYYWAALYRNSTAVCIVNNATGHQSPSNMRQDHMASYLDSPSTTSAITYTIKVSDLSNGGSVRFLVYTPRLTLMEIAG